ncbi:MAG: MarR family winged helix-turn-helix transcriptional regulator [Planctomycetota bacterium]
MTEPNRPDLNRQVSSPETDPKGVESYPLSAGTIGGLGLSSAFGPVLPTPSPVVSQHTFEEVRPEPVPSPAAHQAGPSIAGRIEPEVPADADEQSPASPGALVEALLHAGHRLRGALDSKFAGLKLSDARFVALKVIRDSAPHGCTQAHLANKLGQCESSISTLVERMRASQLLYRLRSKSDRRKRVLMLTEEGRRLLEEATVVYDQEAERVLGHIEVDRRMTFAELLEALSTGLDRADDGVDTVRRAA